MLCVVWLFDHTKLLKLAPWAVSVVLPPVQNSGLPDMVGGVMGDVVTVTVVVAVQPLAVVAVTL